jgi:hypothetical protein
LPLGAFSAGRIPLPGLLLLVERLRRLPDSIGDLVRHLLGDDHSGLAPVEHLDAGPDEVGGDS